MYIKKMSQINDFADNTSFSTGEVYRLFFPCLEGCEEQADQICLVGLDSQHVALRKEQYTLDWDWQIVHTDDLAEVLGEALAQTMYELEQIELQRADAADDLRYA